MTERTIFLEALEKPSAQAREAYLEAICRDDPNLRQRVEKLLAAHAAAGGVLDRVAVGEPNTALYQPLQEGPGTTIGPYKLLQQIGEGGFGVVYMAEQQEPVRRMVALKIIKPGMDTRDVIARFESERQALAIMDHPNIARVFDAGATNGAPGGVSPGRPFFVMELVKGVPITEFCDKNHMPAAERLKLFVSVCQAIQHAHHKGVIHRDIKPSNVMVTLHDGVPVPKVIDFGVAKATAQKLTEKTLFTAYGQMIGTPAYMSPEQAEMSGLDIDTRSDIYSLGVLLYELLTGTTPIDSKRLRTAGYMEMQRLIREEEAQRPSTRLSSLGGEASILAGNRGTDPKRLVQMLAGDLDWIVMKALEKDRNRRYASPGTFADDLGRYLRGDAVEARPPTPLYRFEKFVRRNRPLIYGLAAFLILLGLGLYGTGTGMYRAIVAEKQAREDAERAREAESLAEERLVQIGAERDAAVKAQARAAVNAEMFQKAAALEDSRRLAAHSVAVRPTDTGLALLLAIRGAEKTPVRSASTNDALLAALRECREEKTIYAAPYQTPEGRTGRTEFTNLAVTPDGTRAIVSAFRFHDPIGDFYTNRAQDDSAQVCDLNTGQVVASIKLAGLPLVAMAVSPDGTILAGATDQGVIVRYADGELVAYTERVVRLWDMRTGKELKVLKGHTDRVTSICFDASGARLLTASFDKTARIWDMRTGQSLHVLDGGKLSLSYADFSPNGKRVITVPSMHQLTGNSAVEESIRSGYFPDKVRADELKVDPPSRPDAKIRWLVPSTGMGSSSGAHEAPRLWDAGTGRLIGQLGEKEKGDVWSNEYLAAAFSADGDRVITANQLTTQVWTADDGKLVTGVLPLKNVPGELLKDGARVFRSCLETANVFREGIGLVVWQSDEKRQEWQRAQVSSRMHGSVGGGSREDWPFIDVALQGRPLAARAVGHAIVISDMITNVPVAELRGHEERPTAAAFLPGQRLVSTGKDGTIRIWNLRPEYSLVSEIRGPRGAAIGTAFFIAGGKQIVTAPTRDQFSRFAGSALALHDAATGVHVRDMADSNARATNAILKETIGELCDVDVSSDGERMVTVHLDHNVGPGREQEPTFSADYTPVRIWDMQTGKLQLALQGFRRSVATARFSPDGKRLLTFADGNHRYAILRDGKRFGSGSGGQLWARVDVWDATNGAHLRNIVPETKGGGTFALWTPDGKSVVTNALYHINNVGAEIFDADTGARVRQLKSTVGGIDRAVISADGKLLIGWRTNFLRGQLQVDIWDVASGAIHATLRGHTGEITSAQFSPDLQSVVTTSTDGTARLWDVATGKEQRLLRAHRHVVRTGRFSPDGRWIVTASTDGTARIWNAESGLEWLLLPCGSAEVLGADFSPDGKRVLTTSTDGIGRLWPVDPLPLALQRKPRELTADERARFQIR